VAARAGDQATADAVSRILLQERQAAATLAATFERALDATLAAAP
jgi:hypothetical protein